MQSLLTDFFLQKQDLTLPGIGNFKLLRHPARYDITSRSFLPPVHEIDFTNQAYDSIQPIIGFIAQEKNLTEEDAFDHFQQFAQQMLQQLNQGNTVHFAFGSLVKSGEQPVSFTADPKSISWPILEKGKVVRQDAVHDMTVGDSVTTNTQMKDYLLTQQTPKVQKWWLWPLITAALAIGLIIWHYWL